MSKNAMVSVIGYPQGAYLRLLLYCFAAVDGFAYFPWGYCDAFKLDNRNGTTGTTTATANTAYEALLVPQTCTTVSILIDNKTYTYTGSIKLESGKIATLNLNVGRAEITLEGITVNPWTAGETVNGGEAVEQ